MIEWKEHKLLNPPTAEEMAVMQPDELIRAWEMYHEAIRNAEDDPYRFGFTLPHWGYADELLAEFNTLLLLGANRSGKTSYCARKIVEAAISNPNSLIYCFSQNREISIQVQQSAIYYWLPKEYKKKQFSAVENLNFSFKNGFTDSSFILPNGSRVVFKFYTQWLQDDTILEGMELGSPEPTVVNIGAWCDEYLLGMDLLDRLYLRLATRGAKLLVSFTPKDGETETVKTFRRDAKVKGRKQVTEGLSKPYSLPTTEVNERRGTGIIYFHSKDNPWSGYPTLLQQCIGKGDDNYTLTALYGFPTKSASTIFPRFQELNIVQSDKVPKDVTRYMVIDPAGRKPWFMCWIAVDVTDTWYVYREWPAGEWAREAGSKWVAGEACREKLGYGVREYVELITELEQGEKIMQRLIDPRMGAAKYTDLHGGGQSDYISDLEKCNMVVIPAPGIEEEPGLQAIQDRLSWNENKGQDAQNRPRLFVTSDCPNVIKSLQEYDATARTEALKDPVDVLRYAAVHIIPYVDGKSLRTTRIGSGGY